MNDYDRLVYFIPPSSGCGGNVASLGGFPPRARITAGLDLHVVAHELGHTFGLRHSHGLSCTDGVTSGTCTEIEYGDQQDVMGDRDAHMNAFQKQLLGWLDYGVSPPIQEVTTTGTYTVAPIESNDAKVKGIRVLRGIDPVTGQKSWYYLEYRQPIGFDQGLFTTSDIRNHPENLANGVLIHKATEGDSNSSFLLDMTPGSDPRRGTRDLRDPALVVGKSYVDAAAGLTITTIATDSNGATVSVQYGSGGTSNTPPVANDDSASTTAGTAVTISVLANDSDPDGDSLSVTSVSGVSGTAQINANGTITYTPPTGFTGTSTFGYGITDGKGGTAGASVSVSVTASNTGTTTPLTVTGMTPNTTYAQVNSVDVAITGTGFVQGASIKFENGSGPAPTASNLVVVGSTTITARVNVKDGGPSRDRIWNVRVTNPNGSSVVLQRGFTIRP